MNSTEIRNAFLIFFKNKNHQIIKSASIVIKDDPSLMFINAGMNQFKDIFLNNKKADYKRVTNIQKCLRVSGKHNDLEEVGFDTYHHTMFEMLGNWSFGDYFKEEAINMAWEFLVDVLKIDTEILFVTVFEGDASDKIEFDNETYNFWRKYLPENHIIKASKKDNFWEMGNQGPCGPCSEIHIDLRNKNEIAKNPGCNLVNKNHSLVIEIWNLVFIQYNRKANGNLEQLPLKHIDTGMGFERLCMVMQNKKSNYDIDIFQIIIGEIENLTNLKYGENEKIDIAMRVVSDHIRTIAFSISDGQLPSNNKAGYVIRRILRRAVRFAYTFLNQKNVFLTKLIPSLVKSMNNFYPELEKQLPLIQKVIEEEEKSFLKTLDIGINLLNNLILKTKEKKCNIIDGKSAFALSDTYGFPIDLTQLILKEQNMNVDLCEYEAEMKIQKNRSRGNAEQVVEDWTIINNNVKEKFIGYDFLETEIEITRFRKIIQKNSFFYQLVFNLTPFYAEAGGQIGDSGHIESNNEKIDIYNTKNENGIIVHLVKKLPTNLNFKFNAVVNKLKRENICNNHTATHLLHQSLRIVLGSHVEQKGSLVNDKHIRFDFSHFQKLTEIELIEIEKLVNKLIRNNNKLEENRQITIEQAKKQGAIALFGEKYANLVRTIKFGNSIELCGGTHTKATGNIGMFKIISESAISAGVRRIEAITGTKVEKFVNNKLEILNEISTKFNNPKNLITQINNLIIEKQKLEKQIQEFENKSIEILKNKLISEIIKINGIETIISKININSSNAIKNLAFSLKNSSNNLFVVLGTVINNKPNLTIVISEKLVKTKNLHAGNIIRKLAKEIKGGGGGQAFYATAGGNDINALEKALKLAEKHILEIH